jgi:2-dehydro-3-deoxygluconokinase
MARPSRQYDVITMGETMMAFEALDYGPLRENVLFKKWIGGAEDNFIIGLARLGFHCGWFSRLGQDEFGKEILRTIRGEGVDVSRVIMDEGAQTGVFFVESHAGGDPRCYYYRRFSAASRLSPNDIDADYISRAKVIYATGITPALGESARETAEALVRFSRENNQVMVFDPNLRLKLWGIKEARDVLIPLMQNSIYTLPGADELKLLMDCSDLAEAIKKAHGLGITRLIIKRGKGGATIALSNEQPMDIPGFPIENSVSTMGAGDCFSAGFVAGLLTEQSLKECVRWGNALGAFCLRGSGPYQTLPDLEELQRFLAGKDTINR